MNTRTPLTDYVYSLIRTAVPYLVGLLLSLPGADQLIRLIGVEAGDAGRYLTAVVAFLLAFVYYLIVRALEQKWPTLGVFLGVPRRPVYGGELDRAT